MRQTDEDWLNEVIADMEHTIAGKGEGERINVLEHVLTRLAAYAPPGYVVDIDPDRRVWIIPTGAASSDESFIGPSAVPLTPQENREP